VKERILALVITLLLISLASMPVQAEEDVNTQIIISAIGDCTLGSDDKSSYQYSFNDVFKRQRGNYNYFFSKVKEELAKDDLTIANLETPLTNGGKRASKQFSFRGNPLYTNILQKGSVEIVNLANNHTYDYGVKGYQDTQKFLQKAGIKYFGNELKSVVEVKGIKIGFLGYNQQRYNCLGKNIEVFKRQIAKDLKSLGGKCNLIIVSFHWGEERNYYPNNIQRQLGHFAVDSGANLVLGHHPHVIQGIENYRGASIVYSLGNFCFGGNRNPQDKDTFIYQQIFSFTKDGKIIKDNKSNIIPCSISSSPNINNYQPVILSGADKERVLKRLDKYSQKL